MDLILTMTQIYYNLLQPNPWYSYIYDISNIFQQFSYLSVSDQNEMFTSKNSSFTIQPEYNTTRIYWPSG